MNHFSRMRDPSSTRRAAFRRMAMATTLAAGLVFQASCQRESVSPFDPRQLGAANRDAAQGRGMAELRELPTDFPVLGPRARRQPTISELTTRPSAGSPLSLAGPRREISLEQAVRTAVANNREIRAASYNPAIEGARVIEAQARFDPTLFGNVGAEISDRSTAGTLFSEPTTRGFSNTRLLTQQSQSQFTGVSGVRQVLEGGGQIEARGQLRQTDSNPSSALLDPFREADLVVQLTQPLLRDFGGQINRARIDIARNNRRVSILEFRRTVEETIFNVEETYWNLYAAQRQLEITGKLLEGAQRTAELIAIRINADASLLQYAQAQADAETRRSAYIDAVSRVRTLSETLKQLLNDDSMPVSSDIVVVASAAPLDRPVAFDLEEMLDVGQLNRAELAQQQLRIDNATVTLNAAGNNLLPQLNFVGSVNPSGLSEFAEGAVANAADLNRISYSVGMQFEVPIGNREARAIYRRTLLQRYQSIEQYASALMQVALDIGNNHRAVETQWNIFTNSRAARAYHEQALRAILSQEQAGEPLTPFFVRNKLDTQARLAEAETQEVRALAEYNIAVARLERAKGTLLQYNNVTLDERGLPRPRR
jgi:outer membrane protein